MASSFIRNKALSAITERIIAAYMSFIEFLNNLIPASYSQLDHIKAVIVTAISLAVGGAILLLVLYWVLTKSLESKTTILVALMCILLLAGCVVLAMKGYLQISIWILIAFILLGNFLNMAVYGISTSASSGYVIPILLTIFLVGPGAGWVVAFAGCAFVFGITTLQSKKVIEPLIPYKASNLTFDSPALTLIYLLVTLLTTIYVKMFNTIFPGSHP